MRLILLQELNLWQVGKREKKPRLIYFLFGIVILHNRDLQSLFIKPLNLSKILKRNILNSANSFLKIETLVMVMNFQLNWHY